MYKERGLVPGVGLASNNSRHSALILVLVLLMKYSFLVCFFLQESDSDALYRSAHNIQSRTERVCSVVTSEMDNFEPGMYTERVLEAVKMLNKTAMPNFAARVKGRGEKGAMLLYMVLSDIV